MRRLAYSLPALLALSGAALAAQEPSKPQGLAAQSTITSKTGADPLIRQQLDALGYRYEVDDDGDFVVTFSLDDDRNQMAYVISRTETYGKHKIREIWSPAYRAADSRFSADLANRLLEDSQIAKMGGWVKQDDMAVFVVKIPADASTEAFDDAVDYAIRAADQMEAELTPDLDAF